MSRIFKQLKFLSTRETKDSHQEEEIEFFIPGVNSGIYKPVTLVIDVKINETKAGFFRFKKHTAHMRKTLNVIEFDELFEEMSKIKKLRDSIG